jgi:hypothetical protein
VPTTHENGDKASRKRWIIGLSITAVVCAYMAAGDARTHYMRFNKANQIATGHVVELQEHDNGDAPPSRDAHYQFAVNGIYHDGWVEDGDEKLAVGDSMLIHYSSSDPDFNHADSDQPGWRDDLHWSLVLLVLALIGLGNFIWAATRLEIGLRPSRSISPSETGI